MPKHPSEELPSYMRGPCPEGVVTATEMSAVLPVNVIESEPPPDWSERLRDYEQVRNLLNGATNVLRHDEMPVASWLFRWFDSDPVASERWRWFIGGERV